MAQESTLRCAVSSYGRSVVSAARTFGQPRFQLAAFFVSQYGQRLDNPIPGGDRVGRLHHCCFLLHVLLLQRLRTAAQDGRRGAKGEGSGGPAGRAEQESSLALDGVQADARS